MQFVHAAETNYVVLTADQFANDFPGSFAEGPVLAITNDDGELITAIVGDNKAMLAELLSDIAEYTKVEADPGKVEPKVGSSKTVLADH